jgi:hypothetical protein
MEMTQPENAMVLSHLQPEGRWGYMARKMPGAPAFAQWNSVPDAYRQCGCHPDIVERLWDQIGTALPVDCRGLVYSNPALTHPKSGVILAVGLGTWYGLRLLGSLAEEAINAGATARTKFSTGDVVDIQIEFGDGWVFGAWIPNELTWCNNAYQIFEHA